MKNLSSPLRKQPGQIDGHIRQQKQGNGREVGQGPDVPKAVGCRRAVDDQLMVSQVNQPNFRDAVPGVEREPDLCIVGERGVGHFHDQEHIGRGGVRDTVTIRARAQQCDIGLRFGVRVEKDRVLCCNEGLLAAGLSQQVGDIINGSGVVRGHLPCADGIWDLRARPA